MPQYTHPITGEAIGLGQHISWRIQNSIRHWWFILAITVITLVCVTWGLHDNNVIAWWNVWASYMALFIESVVGISMYQQTKADAQVIRKILAMETNQFNELKSLVKHIDRDLEAYHDGTNQDNG
jgi:hypothetical protein